MDDFGNPLSVKGIAKPKRKRLLGSNSSTDPGIADAVFEVPGAIAAGIRGVGRGVSGLPSKLGIGGDGTEASTSDDTGAISGVVEGVGRAASSISGVAGNAVSGTIEGIGQLASNAGSMVSGAGEILSTVADVAGPVAEAAGDAAGDILGGLGDILN
jgi:phage-related protein